MNQNKDDINQYIDGTASIKEANRDLNVLKHVSDSSKETLAKNMISVINDIPEFRFALASKLCTISRGKNIIGAMAEVLQYSFGVPIANILLALKDKELIKLLSIIRVEYHIKIQNIGKQDNIDILNLMAGGKETISIEDTDDYGRKTRKLREYKLCPKLREDLFSGRTSLVGNEVSDQLMLPMGMPEIYEEQLDNTFEIIPARQKLAIEAGLSFSQQEVLFRYRRSERTNHIMDGCIRAGKSFIFVYIALLEIEKHINEKNTGQIIFIGVSAQSVYSNVFKGLIKDTFGLEIPPTNSYTWKIGGLEIRIVGSDRKSMDGLRGITAARIFVDEAQNVFTNEYAYATIRGRMEKDDVKLVMTCNTSSPTHILYDRFLKDVDKYEALSIERYHFSLIKEIEQGNKRISPKLEQQMRLTLGEKSTWYKRDILGLWVCADESIYMIDDEKHVYIQRTSIDYKKYDEIFVGVDQGTNSPRVYIMIGIYTCKVTGNNHVDVINELYYEQGHGHIKSHSDYKKELKDFLMPALDKLRAIYTPHDANDLKLLLRDQGYPANMANRKMKVVEGIGAIEYLLKSGKLKISSDCKHLIRELKTYKFEVKDGKATEKIDKSDDHAPDALRYAITSCGVFCSPDKEIYSELFNS